MPGQSMLHRECSDLPGHVGTYVSVYAGPSLGGALATPCEAYGTGFPLCQPGQLFDTRYKFTARNAHSLVLTCALSSVLTDALRSVLIMRSAQWSQALTSVLTLHSAQLSQCTQLSAHTALSSVLIMHSAQCS